MAARKTPCDSCGKPRDARSKTGLCRACHEEANKPVDPRIEQARELAARYFKPSPIASRMGITLEEFDDRMADPDFADAIEAGRGDFQADLIDAMTAQAGSKSQAALAVAKMIAEWTEPARVASGGWDGKPLLITGPVEISKVAEPTEIEGELIEPPKLLEPAPPDLEAEVEEDPAVEPPPPKSAKFITDDDGFPMALRKPTGNAREDAKELHNAITRWAANHVSSGRVKPPSLDGLDEEAIRRAHMKWGWIQTALEEREKTSEPAMGGWWNTQAG